MQHGFQAYPTLLALNGDTTGMQSVIISGFTFNGPTNGACVYLANCLGVVFQNNKTVGSRYGLAMECCIQTKVLNNQFNNYTNAGIGFLMSSNTSHVYYGYSGSVNGNPSATYWNDGVTISGNVLQTTATNYTLAHILDFGSQSESIRFVSGNSFYSTYNNISTYYGTQYGYVGRNCNVDMQSNWFENVNYPVRILAGNAYDTGNLPGVTGAQPSGTFAISTIPDGYSYSGNFINNYFARGYVDLWLSGITGGASTVGQNLSEFLQNAGTHLYSNQSSSQLVTDTGDSIVAPIGSYTYASFTYRTYNPTFNKFTSYTPTVTASSGTITSYTVNKAIYTQTKADLVQVMLDISITNNGTGAGNLTITLPATWTPIIGSVVGRNFSGDTNALVGDVFSAGIILCKYDGTYPVITGNRFIISGSYQI